MRLKDKVAIVVGAGQSPGEGMGNGRAPALTFGREGAKVLCVDRNLGSAEETAGMITARGGVAAACQADVTSTARRCPRTGLSGDMMTAISSSMSLTSSGLSRCSNPSIVSIILAGHYPRAQGT